MIFPTLSPPAPAHSRVDFDTKNLYRKFQFAGKDVCRPIAHSFTMKSLPDGSPAQPGLLSELFVKTPSGNIEPQKHRHALSDRIRHMFPVKDLPNSLFAASHLIPDCMESVKHGSPHRLKTALRSALICASSNPRYASVVSSRACPRSF